MEEKSFIPIYIGRTWTRWKGNNVELGSEFLMLSHHLSEHLLQRMDYSTWVANCSGSSIQFIRRGSFIVINSSCISHNQ